MMKKNIQQGFVKKIVMLNICFKKVRRKFGKNMLTEMKNVTFKASPFKKC